MVNVSAAAATQSSQLYRQLQQSTEQQCYLIVQPTVRTTSEHCWTYYILIGTACQYSYSQDTPCFYEFNTKQVNGLCFNTSYLLYL